MPEGLEDRAESGEEIVLSVKVLLAVALRLKNARGGGGRVDIRRHRRRFFQDRSRHVREMNNGERRCEMERERVSGSRAGSGVVGEKRVSLKELRTKMKEEVALMVFS